MKRVVFMAIPVAMSSSGGEDDDDHLGPLRSILLRLGRKRFGPEDEKTRSALEAIMELEKLEYLAERMLEDVSWQDLMTNY